MMQGNPNHTVAQVQSLLADAFQVPVEEIVPTLAFGDLPQWDSMGHMEVMLRLEERFGVEINTETIAALVNLPAIVAAVEAAQPENRHA